MPGFDDPKFDYFNKKVARNKMSQNNRHNNTILVIHYVQSIYVSYYRCDIIPSCKYCFALVVELQAEPIHVPYLLTMLLGIYWYIFYN